MTTQTQALSDKSKRANALIDEASPYLLQHAHNPVNWMPWSEAAFEKANAEDKPIFLSVGYAACHWCHVMEHESFENDTIAEFMNEHFISVKVDREERPDIDHFYMQAVQQMSGSGGWPMSVFLTHDRKPFYGGTYWPPTANFGRPGFRDVLHSIADAWKNRRDEILESAKEFHEGLKDLVSVTVSDGDLNRKILENAVRSSEKRFDETYGGFGAAPKFPHAMELNLLLRLSQQLSNKKASEMTLKSLDKMAYGGIYDQIGGGFHRYSTDTKWLVPHFEKMLYDNALLIPVYLDAFLLTKNGEYLRVAKECLDWAIREMEMPEGGFASSLDADSEGEEGKFYVWNRAEVIAILGQERGGKFCDAYDISDAGNFEHGSSILNLPRAGDHAVQFANERRQLSAARDKRVRPQRDDKVLTDWNGFMISALVKGYTVTDNESYLNAAVKAADRLLAPFEKNKRLVHSHLGERTQDTQLLLDYSAFGNGLLDLYLATNDIRWFDGATALARKADELFFTQAGPYRMSADSVAGEISVDFYDNAMPSGVSMAGILNAKIYFLTGEKRYLQACEKQIKPLAGYLEKFPAGFTQLLTAADMLIHPPAELVIAGEPNNELWKTAHESYYSNLLVITFSGNESKIPVEMRSLLEGKESLDRKATAYLCFNFACDFPILTADELKQKLDTLTKP